MFVCLKHNLKHGIVSLLNLKQIIHISVKHEHFNLEDTTDCAIYPRFVERNKLYFELLLLIKYSNQGMDFEKILSHAI